MLLLSLLSLGRVSWVSGFSHVTRTGRLGGTTTIATRMTNDAAAESLFLFDFDGMFFDRSFDMFKMAMCHVSLTPVCTHLLACSLCPSLFPRSQASFAIRVTSALFQRGELASFSRQCRPTFAMTKKIRLPGFSRR